MNITGIGTRSGRINFYEKVSEAKKMDVETEAEDSKVKGSNFMDHLNGNYSKVPYGNLAQDGTITYKGVVFVCDEQHNRICLGDVSDEKKCLNIRLKDGGSLTVNRDNLGDLSKAITMFCPEDINRILTAIAEDKQAQQVQWQIQDEEASAGLNIEA